MPESQFLLLVRDSYRFILWARGAIESYPLQTYASALVFAPTNSLTRKAFEHEEPDWVVTKPRVDPEWSQCIQTFYGHSSPIWSVACSPNGTLIASGSEDCTIKIWEEESGHRLKTLVGHEGTVWSVSFSPDGTRIASGSSDCTVRIWDVNRGECLRTLSDHKLTVNCVSFSPDGQVASASKDWTIKIWDSDSGKLLKTIRSLNKHAVVTFISKKHVAVPDPSGKIIIWDIESGTRLRVLAGHPTGVDSIAIATTLDGHIISSSRDGTVKLWGSDNACLQTLNHHEPVRAVAISSNRNVISGASRSVYLWDLKSGSPPNKMEGHVDTIRSVASTANGNIVSCGDDATVRLWNSTGTHCGSGDSRFAIAESFAFSAFSAGRIASQHEDGSVRIWDSNTGLCLQTLDNDNNAFTQLAFSPDGILASGSDDGMIRIWDPEDGKCLNKFEAHDDGVKTVAFSPDRNNIVCGLSNGEIRIFNSMNGFCVTRFKASDNTVRKISVSTCGIIASWCGHYGDGGNRIKLWQTNGVPLKTLEPGFNSCFSMDFSHDGTRLMARDIYDRNIIWDTISYECLEQEMFNLDKVSFSLDKGWFSLPKASKLIGPRSRPHYALHSNGEWITYDGEKVLWLPVEYRPAIYKWAVDRADAGNRLVISCQSGQMLIFGLSTSQTPL